MRAVKRIRILHRYLFFCHIHTNEKLTKHWCCLSQEKSATSFFQASACPRVRGRPGPGEGGPEDQEETAGGGRKGGGGGAEQDLEAGQR